MSGVELEACQSLGRWPGRVHAAYRLCPLSSFVGKYTELGGHGLPGSGYLKKNIGDSMLD